LRNAGVCAAVVETVEAVGLICVGETVEAMGLQADGGSGSGRVLTSRLLGLCRVCWAFLVVIDTLLSSPQFWHTTCFVSAWSQDYVVLNGDESFVPGIELCAMYRRLCLAQSSVYIAQRFFPACFPT
jgi:hypothetical protein